MTMQTWLAFAVASGILLIVPGPTIMIVASFAIGNGRASAVATVPGAVFGDFTAMTLSLLGAGAILAASATLFTALKLLGAAYLVWLGLQLWFSDPSASKLSGAPRQSTRRSMFWSCYLVTALNPKSIVFFIAFVPQFVNAAGPAGLQFVILEATFLTLAAVSLVFWASLAGVVRVRLQRPGTVAAMNRIGGGFLIAAGVIAATARR